MEVPALRNSRRKVLTATLNSSATVASDLPSRYMNAGPPRPQPTSSTTSSGLGIANSASVLGPGCNGEACPLPFRKTVFEASGPVAAPLKLHDGLVGVDAVRPAAVGDDFGVAGECPELLAQLGDRNGTRTDDMPGFELGGGAHVEHDHVAGA